MENYEAVLRSAPVVFVVDDDDDFRDALCRLLKTNGFRVYDFGSAEEFLAGYVRSGPGCLLLDVRMPGMSGLDLQRCLGDRGIELGIVVLTGHGDVPMAVSALQQGAVDFLEKPFGQDRLLASIRMAIERNMGVWADRVRQETFATRLESLTPREREVLDRLVDGRSTKQIALEFGTNDDTVRKQRASILRKMHADGVASLVRMVLVVQG